MSGFPEDIDQAPAPVDGTLSDIDLLENLQAAEQTEAFPEQNNPLRNVPEEVLRNLDGLVVQMEDTADEAETAKRVANEAIALSTSGRIDAHKAEELAKDVPEILGTKEAPLSYSSVPTSVGLKRAVEILEAGAAATRSVAVTKAKDLIDRAIIAAEGELDVNERDWVSAVSSYGVARANVLEACGGMPESSYSLYIGDTPSTKVLDRISEPGMDNEIAASPTFTTFKDEIKTLVSRSLSSPHNALVSNMPFVAVGDDCYLMSDLFTGQVTGGTATPAGYPTYGDWLSLPATYLNDRVTLVRSCMTAMLEKLRTINATLNADAQGPAASATETATSISEAVRIAAILSRLGKAIHDATDLAVAATNFYQAYSQGGVVERAIQASQESIASPWTLRKPGRLFK